MKFINFVCILGFPVFQLISSQNLFAVEIECRQTWIRNHSISGSFEVPVRDYVLNNICESIPVDASRRLEDCQKELFEQFMSPESPNDIENAISFLREHIPFPEFNEIRFRKALEEKNEVAIVNLVSYLTTSEDLIVPSIEHIDRRMVQRAEYTQLTDFAEVRFSGGITTKQEEVLGFVGSDISRIRRNFGGSKIWFYSGMIKSYKLTPVVVRPRGQEPKIVLNYLNSSEEIEKFDVYPLGVVNKEISYSSPDGKVHVHDHLTLDCRIISKPSK